MFCRVDVISLVRRSTTNTWSCTMEKIRTDSRMQPSRNVPRTFLDFPLLNILFLRASTHKINKAKIKKSARYIPCRLIIGNDFPPRVRSKGASIVWYDRPKEFAIFSVMGLLT